MNDIKLKIDQELKYIKKITNDPTLLITVLFSIFVVSFFVLVPLSNILKESFTSQGDLNLDNYRAAFTRSGNVVVIFNTIKLGLVTATLGSYNRIFLCVHYILYDHKREEVI